MQNNRLVSCFRCCTRRDRSLAGRGNLRPPRNVYCWEDAKAESRPGIFCVLVSLNCSFNFVPVFFFNLLCGMTLCSFKRFPFFGIRSNFNLVPVCFPPSIVSVFMSTDRQRGSDGAFRAKPCVCPHSPQPRAGAHTDGRTLELRHRIQVGTPERDISQTTLKLIFLVSHSWEPRQANTSAFLLRLASNSLHAFPIRLMNTTVSWLKSDGSRDVAALVCTHLSACPFRAFQILRYTATAMPTPTP